MFSQFKFPAMVVGGIFATITVYSLHTADDLNKNYILVDGSITQVTTDCFIKKRRGEIVDKKTNQLAYMDCRIAPLVAAKHDYSKSDIKKRAKISYRYTSPVDKRMYDGSFERKGRLADDAFVPGRKIQVHAHKSKPAESRFNTSNPFVDRSGS
ncbi:MAG: hypothetical protein AAF299_20850 [Pseudomonadota bacterium]